LLAVLVGALGAATFSPALGGDYILDDRTLILVNPFIHSFRFWTKWFHEGFWGNLPGPHHFHLQLTYFRPLVTGSYALDWHLGGGSPLVFHVTNLVAYAAASALTFWTLRRWIGAWLPALVAALVITVHPTRAESVAWISGRTDVFCAIGILVAAAGAARRLRRERGGIPLEVAGTLFAYLTKETAIVLPAFVAIEAWVAADRPPLDLKVSKRVLVSALPEFGAAVAYLAARAVWMPIEGSTSAPKPVRAFGAHTELVLETLGRATKLCFFPVHLTLGEGTIRLEGGTRVLFSAPYVALGAVTLAALIAGALAARRRAPGVALGLVLFCVTYLPTSNLVPTRLVTMFADRFLFLPLFGLALALGIGLRRLMARPRVVAAFGGAAILLLGTGAVARAHDYSNRRSFWRHEIARNPYNIAAFNREADLMIQDRHYAQALHDLAQANALAARYDPISNRPLTPLLHTIELLARLTPDAKQNDIRKLDAFYVAALHPSKYATAHFHVHGVNVDLPLHAVPTLDALRRLQPRLLAGHAELASRLGESDAALDAAHETLATCVNCADTTSRAALVLARQGRYPEALAALAALARFRGEDDYAGLRQIITEARGWAERARQAQGPAALQARATELSTLGAYGRAFAVLAPYQSEIENAPGMVLGFANLAWCAGHFDVARQVLSGRMSAPQIAKITHGWSEKMGWVAH
jgi:protein O-mannosyl-transferase